MENQTKSRNEYSKKYYQNNKEKLSINHKIYYKNNKEKIKEHSKLYRKNHKAKLKEYYKEYGKKNADKIKKTKREYRKNNKDKRNIHMREYYKNNNDKMREYHREYQRKRHKDPTIRLNHNITRAINKSLKGNKNGHHWEDLVGYTLEQLKKHLGKQFAEGMSWDNHSKDGWVIDHKIPISVFNFTKPEHEDFKRCWALANLQPMWAEKNFKKHAKIDKHFQPSLLL